MKPPPYVVIVVMDGLRPDLISLDSTPSMFAFMQRGVTFPNSRSVFPSSTRVNAASFSTGSAPGSHGLVANQFYDRTVDERRNVNTGDLTDFLSAQAAYQGRFISAASIGDALASAGMSMVTVSSGSAGTARITNPNAERHGHVVLCLRDWDACVPSDDADRWLSRFGPIPEQSLPNSDRMAYQTTLFMEGVFPERKPNVSLLWYNDPDFTFHYRGLGSEDAKASLRALDREFQRLLEWSTSPSVEGDVQVILMSDHGHLTADEKIDIVSEIQQAGFDLSPESSSNLCGVASYSGVVHARRGGHAELQRFADWLGEQPWVGLMLSPHGSGINGSIVGTMNLDAVYPPHSRSPGLYFTMRADERYHQNGIPGCCLFSGKVPVGGSIHGGLNRYELNNLLVLSGSAFKAGARLSTPVSIIDVVPTVLSLLNVPIPDEMTGRVIREAFAHTEDETYQVKEYSLIIQSRSGVQKLTFLEHAGRRILQQGTLEII